MHSLHPSVHTVPPSVHTVPPFAHTLPSAVRTLPTSAHTPSPGPHTHPPSVRPPTHPLPPSAQRSCWKPGLKNEEVQHVITLWERKLVEVMHRWTHPEIWVGWKHWKRRLNEK